jgi:hypothetical protein
VKDRDSCLGQFLSALMHVNKKHWKGLNATKTKWMNLWGFKGKCDSKLGQSTMVSINGWMGRQNAVCTCTMEYYPAIKRMKLCHLPQHEWNWRPLCKWSKSDTARQILHVLTHLWNLKSWFHGNRARIVAL